MGIILNDNIKINAGKPIDTRFLNSGNTSYPTKNAVFSAIPITERYVGLTVLVNSGSVGNTELWFKTGVTDSDLIEKKFNTIIPTDDFITGGTNLGYFSGFTGVQILPIDHLTNQSYDGNYVSLYNNYYRDDNGFIRIGIASDGIGKRGYLRYPTPLSPVYKSWIWNEYVGGTLGGTEIGWILIDGNISEQVGTYQYGISYYLSPSHVHNETSYTTGIAYPSLSNVSINAVVGSLSTGDTLTIGGRSLAYKENNNLFFRTIVSDTPNIINVWDDDDSLIHLSGVSSLNNIVNSGNIGFPVYSGSSGTTFVFKKIAGGGGTTVSDLGEYLLINSTGNTSVNNGLKLGINGIVSLGGVLTGNTIFDGGVSLYNLQYSGDYSGNFTNRTLVDKQYVDTVASGLNPKQAVLVATTGNTVLAGLISIDGVLLIDGDRILVKDQTISANNGIYSATTGTWGRTSDFDENSEVISGAYVWVLSGNTNKGTAWVLNTPDPITVGATELNYVLFNVPQNVESGVGIIVSASTYGNVVSFDGGNVAGNCITWDGSQLNLSTNTISTINNSITGATNGLTKIGSDVILGGTLTGYSEIVLGSNSLNIVGVSLSNTNGLSVSSGYTSVCVGDNVFEVSENYVSMYGCLGTMFIDPTIASIEFGDNTALTLSNYGIIATSGSGQTGIEYDQDYSLTFVDESLVTKRYVDNTVTVGVCAANGLSKVGNTIVLGGELTGNSTINGGFTLNFCSGASLNTQYGYQISGQTILRTSVNSLSSIYLGYKSGFNDMGLHNIGIGECNLYSNTCGFNNISLGSYSLSGNTNGCHNISMGLSTLSKNTTGCHNIGIGCQSLISNTTASYNIGIGTSTLRNNSTGANNIAEGQCALHYNTSGSDNVAMGQCSLHSNTCGLSNIAIGRCSLFSNTIGSNSVGIGCLTLKSNISGSNNIGVGALALFKSVSGNSNVAIGVNALCGNIGGCNNVAIGSQALQNTTSSNNVGQGALALFTNTTGCYNIALGTQSLFANISGSNNIGIGGFSLASNTTGSGNVAIGCVSLNSNTTGRDNVALGGQNLYSNISGCYNIAQGSGVLFNNTTGCYNIASGFLSMYCNTSGSHNIAQGCASLKYNNIGSFNIALGYHSLSGNTSGCHNIALGESSLYSNTTGCHNIAQGYNSLALNTVGYNNIGIGCESLFSNTNGYSNIALGNNTLRTNDGGGDNIAIGESSLYSNIDGYDNISLGNSALYGNTSGVENIAIGLNTLSSNTVGCNNIALGEESQVSNVDGLHNIGLGRSALCLNVEGCHNIGIGCESLSNNVSGSSNIAIGELAGAFQANGITALTNTSNSIYIGKNVRGFSNLDDNSIVIGSNAIGIGANTIVLGDSGITTTQLTGDLFMSVDDTYDIGEINDHRPKNIYTSGDALIGDDLTYSLRFAYLNRFSDFTPNLTQNVYSVIPIGTYDSGTYANVTINTNDIAINDDGNYIVEIGGNIVGTASNTYHFRILYDGSPVWGVYITTLGASNYTIFNTKRYIPMVFKDTLISIDVTNITNNDDPTISNAYLHIRKENNLIEIIP